jgi:hypothetical protein
MTAADAPLFSKIRQATRHTKQPFQIRRMAFFWYFYKFVMLQGIRWQGPDALPDNSCDQSELCASTSRDGDGLSRNARPLQVTVLIHVMTLHCKYSPCDVSAYLACGNLRCRVASGRRRSRLRNSFWLEEIKNASFHCAEEYDKELSHLQESRLSVCR